MSLPNTYISINWGVLRTRRGGRFTVHNAKIFPHIAAVRFFPLCPPFCPVLTSLIAYNVAARVNCGFIPCLSGGSRSPSVFRRIFGWGNIFGGGGGYLRHSGWNIRCFRILVLTICRGINRGFILSSIFRWCGCYLCNCARAVFWRFFLTFVRVKVLARVFGGIWIYVGSVCWIICLVVVRVYVLTWIYGCVRIYVGSVCWIIYLTIIRCF